MLILVHFLYVLNLLLLLIIDCDTATQNHNSTKLLITENRLYFLKHELHFSIFLIIHNIHQKIWWGK